MRVRIDKPVSVLFLLSLQSGRPIAAGRDSSADGIIALAGGLNALGSIEGFKPVSNEAVIAAAPDVVVMMSNAGVSATSDEVFALPAFAATPAGQRRAFITMDGLYLLGFGPRAPDAARDLMNALYPALKIPALPEAAGRL
jgi:iron complex transport system substrate-binding protein